MSRDVHERARELLSCGDQTSSAEQKWLQQHLAECAACREVDERIDKVVHTLRGVAFTARPALVRSTQLQVRLRTTAMRGRRERAWLVLLSSALVSVFAWCSNAVLWEILARLGKWTGVPGAVWQAGFAMFWIAPTVAAGFLLLAHGTHLAERNGGTKG